VAYSLISASVWDICDRDRPQIVAGFELHPDHLPPGS